MIKLIIAQLERISKGIPMWENVAKIGKLEKLEMTVEMKKSKMPSVRLELTTFRL